MTISYPLSGYTTDHALYLLVSLISVRIIQLFMKTVSSNKININSVRSEKKMQAVFTAQDEVFSDPIMKV